MDIVSTQVGQNIANFKAEQQELKSNQASAVTPVSKEDETNATTAKLSVQDDQSSADNLSNSDEQNENLASAMQEIESFLQVQNRNLAFSFDDDANRSVVTVKDSSSGDVIRQIPSEEVLRLAERIKELQEDVGNSVGVLLNNQV